MTPGSQAISSVHPAVRLRIPSRSERVKDGIQFIGVRNPAHPDDQEMIEVDYKLEERSQGDGSEDMAQEHFHESPNASDTQPQPVQIARAEGISETLPSRQTDIDTRQTSHPSLTESRPGAHLSFPSTSYRASTTFSGRFQTPEWDYTTYRSTESQTQNSNAPSAGTPDADITRLSIQPHVDTDDRSRDGPNDPDVVGADSRPSPMPRHSTVHRDSTSHSDDMTLIRTTDVQRIPSQDHPSRIAPEQSTSSLGGSSRSPAISTPAARSPGTSGVSNTLSPSFKAESERDIIEIRSEPPPTVSDLSDEVLTFLNGVSEDSQSFIHAFSGLGFRTGRHLDALCRRPESQRAEFRKILWDEHGIKYGDITLLEDELDRRRENLRSGT
ncbi:hypothetical protein CERSUDRAFT_90848 [Gelatoporia subvermispora B]|uniref:Uncharacterized protein n=1 Tax=Ceriporiopsis subvermispora (strain B) TaxID=914234 RepID=M2RTG5_CERS8|nr:hypothetical protein CERSUDRAFT_90848 [Gelatoporia subvermispora B]